MGALLTSLSVLAGVLLAVGVFGVLSAMVGERAKEMALRLALGATPRQVAGQLVSYASRITLVAAALGVLVAWSASHLLRSLLYGVNTNSISPYVWALAAIVGATLAASIGPLRRALSVEPMDVLRD
jgi:ABC-type antimicrobial peptide transport system permease subunit